jgi:hypothetical protein
MSKRAEATWVLFGFTCLAVAATYPLVLGLGGRLPSDLGDPLLTAWTLAWDADRLRHGLSGIWDAPSFFPYRHTLLYSDHLIGVALFTAPLQWLTRNPVLVYNVAFLASYVVSGAGMYLLARELTGRRDAALVAGVIYACLPFRTSHLAHLQWLITGWLPLSLWALHRYFATRASPYAIASTVFFLLQSLTAAYFTYFALLPLLIVGLVEWRRARVPPMTMWRHFAPAAALALVVMLPVARAYYVVREDTGQRRSGEEIERHSADVGDYFSAAPRLRLWGGLGSGRGEHELFPGAAALGLAAIAIVAAGRSPHTLLYAAVLGSAFVLSLGPAPSAWGQRLGVPGPYGVLLHVVPGLDGLRAPARLAVVVYVALSVLAAFGAAWVIDRVKPPARAIAIAVMAAVVAAEGWAAPIATPPFDSRGDPGTRAAYAYLKVLPPGAVMELPTAAENAEPEFVYQYMTLVHGHRVVNGHSGYVTPLALWLGGGHSPFRESPRQGDAVALLRGIGVRYLVLHRAAYEDRSLADAMRAVIEGDHGQIAAHRTFGETTVAALTPLDLPAAPSNAQAIPLATIRAQASHSADRLPSLFDGDPDSRWLTGAHQSGGEWLQLDLDRSRDVGVLRMQLAVRSFGDYPRDLAIEAVEDSGTRTLFRGSVLPMLARGVIADGEYPVIEIVLPRNHARALRLRQLAATRTFFWSIHELQLLERP